MYALSWLKEAISVDHQAAALITTPMVGGITLLLLGAWIARTWRPRKPPFPVLTNPSAKFFADEYDDARQLFREKAEAAGAAVHILPLEGECWGGMCGDPDAFQGEDRLTVDVAVLSSPSDSGGAGPLLLHMSGVHGVEGHAGSAIQAKWLDMVAKKETTVPKGVTVVLVHVMNPYGFKHGRRYNENNVDLNRNMLVGLDGTPVEDGCDFSWACESHPVKADYDKFSPVMNYNRRWHCPVDDALFFLKTAYLLCRYKYTSLKRAAVSGQYHNRNGIWYGGSELQSSYRQLLGFLQRECAAADPVLFIDVHTGLGPQGVDTMLADSGVATNTLLQQVFGEANQPGGYIMGDVEDDGNAAAGYDDTKGFSASIIPALVQAGCSGWRRAHAVTQEFGTVSPISVIKAAARENAAWVNGASVSEATNAAQNVRDVFYVRTPEWQESIVARGLEAIEKATEALERRDDIFF